MRIAKEALPYSIFLLLVAAISYSFSTIVFIIVILCLSFVIFFFRNPNRKIDYNDNYVLSPADGRIQAISTIKNNYYEGEAIKISIFLSLFNVHINRSPVQGIIRGTSYRPGKYLPAFKSHASELNERNTVIVENNKIKVVVHQITGFIARRIVCYKKEGDLVSQGEIFGLIKFGSCTEIIVPSDIELFVKEGDRVQAGKTVMGEVKNDKKQC